MPSLESRIIRGLNPDLSADDCALIEHGGEPYLYTTDSLAQDTHFRLDWSSPEDIAFKLLHVNLSDLWAAGGMPEFCLLNLGLPDPADEALIQRFSSCFRHLLREHRIALVGGDTFRSIGYLFSLTLFGPALQPRFRRAQPGDGLFLSGHVGLSQLGYKLLESGGRPRDLQYPDDLKATNEISTESASPGAAEPADYDSSTGSATRNPPLGSPTGRPIDISRQLQSRNWQHLAIARHLRPRANLEAARQLNALQAQHFPVSGAMDLSDGIFADCNRFAESSGLSLRVELERLSMVPAVLEKGPVFAAGSGEELELLVASPEPLPEGFVRIGTFDSPSPTPAAIFYLNQKPVKPALAFEHFQ